MASIKTKFAVGVFVIFGLVMAILAVVWLGMANYFEKGHLYAAYFDESVQGLDKDSPVKYRGVSIGRVHSIGVAPDAKLIQVILKIETDVELDKSIVARLKSVGITGIMFVELEKIDSRRPLLKQQIDFPTKYPIINTKPSDIKQFFDAVNEALLGFKELDVSGISDSIQTTLEKIDQAIEDLQLQRLSKEITTALEQIQLITDTAKWHAIMDGMDTTLGSINSLAGDSRAAVSKLGATLEHFDQTIVEGKEDFEALFAEMNASAQEITSLAQNGSFFISRSNTEIARFMSQLSAALQHYEKAGRNLNKFLESIADQPSQLLFAAPPERDEIATGERDTK